MTEVRLGEEAWVWNLVLKFHTDEKRSGRDVRPSASRAMFELGRLGTLNGDCPFPSLLRPRTAGIEARLPIGAALTWATGWPYLNVTAPLEHHSYARREHVNVIRSDGIYSVTG